MPRPKKVCKYQIVCIETPDDRYHCESRLLEGYNCTCPYDEEDIRIMDEFGDRKYELKIQKNFEPGADGICRDFRILQNVKKDLIAKVVMELKKQ